MWTALQSVSTYPIGYSKSQNVVITSEHLPIKLKKTKITFKIMYINTDLEFNI